MPVSIFFHAALGDESKGSGWGVSIVCFSKTKTSLANFSLV